MFSAQFGLAFTPILREQRRLTRVRGTCNNRIAFLVGNGPSVEPVDLNQIAPRISFACNRLYLAYDKFSFRPSHLVSADPHMIADFGPEIASRAESPVWFVNDKVDPRIGSKAYWIWPDWRRPFVFSRDITFGVGVGGATLVAALQIGYYMGIRRFILYGVDHTFSFQKVKDNRGGYRTASGEGNHFIANYRSGAAWAPPEKDRIEEAFAVCDRQLRTEGGFLVNATRGGALDVVERMSFEEALLLKDGPA